MASVAKKTGRDINDFRSLHDKNFIVPKKIAAAIKAMGPHKWEYQADFVKNYQISVTDLAMFREQFSDFVVEISGKTRKIAWCGSKALATKLRAMVP
jgi:hypothetical protein